MHKLAKSEGCVQNVFSNIRCKGLYMLGFPRDADGESEMGPPTKGMPKKGVQGGT